MNIAILFSGTGSNMKALVACHNEADINIRLLLSNVATAGGLEFARASGIPTVVCDHKTYNDRTAHEAAVSQLLKSHEIEIICLAGYMRVLSPDFVKEWRDRIINIHPSLIPLFPGLHTHRRALEAGVMIHGCTVHLVTERLDDGPILGQAAVPVLPGDDEHTLAARVLHQEHILYPTVLRGVARGDSHYADASDRLRNPYR